MNTLNVAFEKKQIAATLFTKTPGSTLNVIRGKRGMYIESKIDDDVYCYQYIKMGNKK